MKPRPHAHTRFTYRSYFSCDIIPSSADWGRHAAGPVATFQQPFFVPPDFLPPPFDEPFFAILITSSPPDVPAQVVASIAAELASSG